MGQGRLFITLFLVLLLSLHAIVVVAAPITTLEDKARLKEKLDGIEQKIGSYNGTLEEKRTRAATLEEELKRLDNSIAKEEEAVNLRTSSLTLLSGEVKFRTAELARLEELGALRRVELAEALEFLREQEDQATVLELFLGGHTLSAGIGRLETITQLQHGIGAELESLHGLEDMLGTRAERLEVRRKEEYELWRIQELAGKELERKRREKDKVLTQTQGEERRYLTLLETTEASAEVIRRQLYVLEGLGVSLEFGSALALAERVEKLAGIRPAFLLAIFKKESHWGGMQGTGNWRSDMPPRDHEAFIAITKELGVNPDSMPVSKKPEYGWGGAMGPAQFIPSTWMGYKDRVAQLTGKSPANPWDITDAFIAAGLKLTEAGAREHTHDSERKAAMIYFAGSNWQNDDYAFYGDGVMEYAAILQEEIDILKRN